MADKTAWLMVCGIIHFVVITRLPKAVSNLDWKNKKAREKGVLFSEMKQFQSPLEAEKVSISLCCCKHFSVAPKCTKLVNIIKTNNFHN